MSQRLLRNGRSTPQNQVTNIPASRFEAVPTDPTYGDYEIAFVGGVKRTMSGMFVSRKMDAKGASWISVRGHGTDSLYRADVVGSITKLVKSNSRVSLTPAELPLRTPAMALRERREQGFSDRTRRASIYQSACDDPSVCGNACDPVCGCGGADCNPPEDYVQCITESFGNGNCGVDPFGNGHGIFRIYGLGLRCDVDLESDTAECFSSKDQPPDLSGTPNLFAGYRTNFTHATLTCYNPVSPGWGKAIYADPRQAGISRIKLVSGGPGTNTIDYPNDYLLGDPAQGITSPNGMKATFWKINWPNPFSQAQQGYCNGSNPTI